MGDVDLAAGGGAFHAGAELVAFTGVPGVAEHPADGVADDPAIRASPSLSLGTTIPN